MSNLDKLYGMDLQSFENRLRKVHSEISIHTLIKINQVELECLEENYRNYISNFRDTDDFDVKFVSDLRCAIDSKKAKNSKYLEYLNNNKN